MKTTTKLGIALIALAIALPSVASTPNSISDFANSTTVEVAEVTSAAAAPETLRIVTGHPDFKIKLVRCEAADRTCVIDLIMENVGEDDVEIDVTADVPTEAYDDKANQYSKKDILVSVGKSGLMPCDMWISGTLYASVPVKARIQIEGVSTSATMFRRLNLDVECKAWNIGGSKTVKMFNIPITREGDDE